MNLSRALLVALLLGFAAPIGLVGLSLPVYAQEEDDDWDSDDAESEDTEVVTPDAGNTEAANTDHANPVAGNIETGDGDEQEQTQQPAASAAEEAKDPFEVPAEMLNTHVDALPDPSRSVEQIKEEAEAEVQKLLEEERRSKPPSDAPLGGN